MPSGKHAVPVISAVSALAAAAAVPAALSAAVAPAVPASPEAVLDAAVTHQLPRARPLATRIISASARKSYTIVSGDTLSGIAGRFCGSASDWPAIWHGNQAAVPDPGVIHPGTRLRLTCAQLAAAVQAAADPAPARPGKTYGVSYGDPNYCGDGDGDGWDVNCQARTAPASAAPAPASAVRVAASVRVSGGTLSFAGLEALWVAAGGPAWAEAAAARVAECESAGRQYAHNSSGASGYFQILGQVVPGGHL